MDPFRSLTSQLVQGLFDWVGSRHGLQVPNQLPSLFPASAWHLAAPIAKLQIDPRDVQNWRRESGDLFRQSAKQRVPQLLSLPMDAVVSDVLSAMGWSMDKWDRE